MHTLFYLYQCAGVFNDPKDGPLPFEHKMKEVKFTKQLQQRRKEQMRSKLDRRKETMEQITALSRTPGSISMPGS